MFVFKDNTCKHKKIIFVWTSLSIFVSCDLFCGIYMFLITLSGDVELNPGLKRSTAKTHWSLISIFARNFANLYLFRANVHVHSFDIICLSETYLDSSDDDESLEISGYYLIHSNHPPNKKPGDICVYHKSFVPLKDNGVCLLDECIAFDLTIINKLCNFRSPDRFKPISQHFLITLKWQWIQTQRESHICL